MAEFGTWKNEEDSTELEIHTYVDKEDGKEYVVISNWNYAGDCASIALDHFQVSEIANVLMKLASKIYVHNLMDKDGNLPLSLAEAIMNGE